MQASSPSPIDKKEARRQYHRQQIAGLVVVSMLIENIELLLFALTGNVEFWVVGLFFLAGVGVSALVYAFFVLDVNLLLKDKNLLVPQLVINSATQIGFMLLAPKLAILFLIVLIVLSSYAFIGFNSRQFTMAWLVYGVMTAAGLWWIRDSFGYPGTSGLEIAIIWAFAFLVLRSLTWPSGRFSALRAKLSEKNRQLEESLLRIEELARRDSLTGIFNHRYFIASLETELQRSARSGQAFCFVMLDLDLFKSINDRFGHPVGDVVLKQTCAIAARIFRTEDVVGRLGGEEFGIILVGTPLDDSLVVIERLRKDVASFDWESVAPGLAVTFSAGVAAYRPNDTVQTITKRADDALYRAKHGGRNRVVSAVAGDAASAADVLSQADSAMHSAQYE